MASADGIVLQRGGSGSRDTTHPDEDKYYPVYAGEKAGMARRDANGQLVEDAVTWWYNDPAVQQNPKDWTWVPTPNRDNEFKKPGYWLYTPESHASVEVVDNHENSRPSDPAGEGNEWVYLNGTWQRVPKESGSWYDWIFSKMAQAGPAFGYNYLGPGTDVQKNIRDGVKPVDELDTAAMYHDMMYGFIKDEFERGEYDYAEAVRRVRLADDQFYVDAMRAGDAYGLLSAYGITVKGLVDYLTGKPWFAGIYPENYGIRPPSHSGSDYFPPDYSGASGANGLIPDNDSSSSGLRYDLYGAIDRNNNGIPDVMERSVGKRKRFHRRYFPYSR